MHVLLASPTAAPSTLAAGLAGLGVRCDDTDALDDLASIIALKRSL